ncbi:MAG TPA: GDSL family lipase [Micromonosporaceae bacterium]|nr:GDSL family lipase [Micromonosporaceae bacterium]HCU50390.1 GDSL family lipase [Micromonosporaceae bacterium]
MSPAEADDPFCLRTNESATLLAGHPWKRFVVLGDSVAQGLGDRVPGYSELPWCDRIAAELRAQQSDLQYLNLGQRDLRAAEVLAAQLEPALAFNPDLALVVCGGNDALKSSYDADAVDEAIAAIVAALQEAGADVITVSIFDISHAPAFPEKVREVVGARMQRFAQHTAALAKRMGTIHIYCTGHPAESDPAMYSADGLHGNMRSHQICAAETVRRLGVHLGNS